MFDASEIPIRLPALATGAAGDLLSWSLGLGFAAIFLAVLGAAGVARPDSLRRRLNGPGGLPRAAAPPGLRSTASASVRRMAWRNDIFWRLTWAAGLALPCGLAVRAAGASLSWVETLYLAGALAALGFVVPGRWRAWREARRREALRLGFPDALDMMVVCVEAGLGLDAALNRVAVEIGPAHPAVASELTRIVRELRAGKERDAVLRGFARRTALTEIASFANLLIQSEALGTGIARTLRVQAEEMRATRLLRAEERAQTLPVKLTLPLVLCVLPAMIAVVLLPGMVTLLRDILPNLGR